MAKGRKTKVRTPKRSSKIKRATMKNLADLRPADVKGGRFGLDPNVPDFKLRP